MTRALLLALPLFISLMMAGVPATAAERSIFTERHAFRAVKLVQGLEHPWSLAFLPDGRMLVTERAGRLRVVSADHKLDARPVAGLPEFVAHGQGGLLDVVLHPQYAQNGWIYFSYCAPDKAGRDKGGVLRSLARSSSATRQGID